MMNVRVLTAILLVAILPVGCRLGEGANGALQVRTFEIQYLDPDEAAQMIDPYIYGDREGNPGMISLGPGTITVRERADNLARIEAVLAQFDKARPGVTLRFQLIEADGASTRDPAIAKVETQLRKLFRYEGYRLIGESVVSGIEGREASGRIATSEGVYTISAALWRVRPGLDGGNIQMGVELYTPDEQALQTSVSIGVRPGQTAVIGSSRPDPGLGALILTVQASFDSIP